MSSPGKPRAILGLMTFGPDPAHGARITTQDDFKDALDLLQSRGYNEVDTARVYCNKLQEAWTREARWKERGLKLATKVLYPSTPGSNDEKGVRESVKTSLRELGCESVDILYLHAADRSTPFLETLKALNTLYTASPRPFHTLGLSNFTAYEVAEISLLCRAHNLSIRPTIYQAMYNAITRGIESELVPACRRYGIRIVVYNPVAGGLLTDKGMGRILKLSGSEVAGGEGGLGGGGGGGGGGAGGGGEGGCGIQGVPKEGRFSDITYTGIRYRERYFRENTFDAVRIIHEALADGEDGLDGRRTIPMAEAALRWLAHHSALKVFSPSAGGGEDARDGVILGVSSKEQLAANLDALEKGPLPEKLVEAMEMAWRKSKGDVVDYWHMGLEYKYDTVKEVFGDMA